MNYRDIITILQKHRDDIKSKIDEGEDVEYFTGAYDEVSLAIEAFEKVITLDAESTIQMKKFTEQINKLEKEKSSMNPDELINFNLKHDNKILKERCQRLEETIKSNNEGWKKTLYECKIQGYSLSRFFENFKMFGDIQKSEWNNEDYDNFMKAYTVVLAQIENVQYELKQLERFKSGFEDVFKLKYKVGDPNSN